MLMVTHDKALANRVARKIEIYDGYITGDHRLDQAAVKAGIPA